MSAEFGLIDLHCHLLPGIDDGARDLDDAIAMAMQAEADGISAICATPHIRSDHTVVIAELPQRRNELSAALLAAGCAIGVLPGGEVAATILDDLDDRDLMAVALGGAARWILLEPARGPLDDRLGDAVEALHARGFRALIAHPERHPAADLIERLKRLVARGALVQVTAAYVTDELIGREMLALARAGMIHVLGTDRALLASGASCRVGGCIPRSPRCGTDRGPSGLGGAYRALRDRAW